MLCVILFLIVILLKTKAEFLKTGEQENNIFVSINGSELVPISSEGDTSRTTRYQYFYNNGDIFHITCAKKKHVKGKLQFIPNVRTFYTYNTSEKSPNNIGLMLYSTSINKYTIGCAIGNTDFVKINFLDHNSSIINGLQGCGDSKPILIIVCIAGVISFIVNIICLGCWCRRIKVTKEVQNPEENLKNHKDITTPAKQWNHTSNEYYNTEGTEANDENKPGQSQIQAPSESFGNHINNYINNKKIQVPALNTFQHPHNSVNRVPVRASDSTSPIDQGINTIYANLGDFSNNINKTVGHVQKKSINTINSDFKRNKLNPIDDLSKSKQDGSNNTVLNTKSGSYNYVYENLEKRRTRKGLENKEAKHENRIEESKSHSHFTDYVNPYITTIH